MDSTADGLNDAPHQLQALHVPDTPAALVAAGFADTAILGSTVVVPGSEGLAASIDGISELDGLALAGAPSSDRGPATGNPNGVVAIDHVVVMTPAADRTAAAFAEVGLDARRVRRVETRSGTRRQTFYWLGDVICEVVGADDGQSDEPSTWWGLALTVADLDATANFFGDRCTEIKDAVQPGRRVTTLRDPAISTPLLFISEHQPS